MRPEAPVKESDIVVEAKFKGHVAHLTPSGFSVYTEIIFEPKVILKDDTAGLRPGVPLSVLMSGGRVQTPDGRLVSTPVPPTEFGLVPGNTYILFLSYNKAFQCWDLIKSWDVTSGVAVPNSREDDIKAREKSSIFAGMPARNFETAIQQRTGAQ